MVSPVSRRGFLGLASLAAGVGGTVLGASPPAAGARRPGASDVSELSGAHNTVPGPAKTGAAGRKAEAWGAFGANFNQNLDSLSYEELRIADARWVRGFFAMPWADDGDPADHYAVRTILEAGKRGFGTVFSLKFPYGDSPLPQPGTDAMRSELERIDKVLPLVVDKVDILTVGNEPFIESRQDERDERLNKFYETVADHVVNYRNSRHGSSGDTSLYMGALNRLDLPENQTSAVERYMRFARDTADIDGVDIHLHIPDVKAIRPFIDYILPRMREDQAFLATEFSLVWQWKDHLKDRISPRFAKEYGYESDSAVWQVIKSAIQHPVPQKEWNAFLSSCPWYEHNRHFLRYLVNIFRQTGKLAVATYGFRQDKLMVEDFGPEKTPWLLNSIYAPYTVQRRKDGTTGRGYGWMEDFRMLQGRRGRHGG